MLYSYLGFLQMYNLWCLSQLSFSKVLNSISETTCSIDIGEEDIVSWIRISFLDSNYTVKFTGLVPFCKSVNFPVRQLCISKIWIILGHISQRCMSLLNEILCDNKLLNKYKIALTIKNTVIIPFIDVTFTSVLPCLVYLKLWK